MVKTAVFAVVIGFTLSAVLTPLLIPALRKLKFGQQVRDDGPESHLGKQGTPTMGGIAFIAAILITGGIFLPAHPEILPILIMTVGFGVIGFIDDFLKIKRKHSEGLKAWEKFLLQTLITAVFCWYMMTRSATGTVIRVPFFDLEWDLKWFYPIFAFFVVMGTDNGVNFTDGVDGLCTTVTIVVAGFFTILAIRYEIGIYPVSAAVCGALMGFLLYNVYPAKIFMGDTGSLALGAFVASAALVLQQPLLILLVGFIYLIEVISVVLQVGYFKLTHGKRIFRMAPIHHHFELGGWSEAKVVAVFSIVTVLLCMAAYLGI